MSGAASADSIESRRVLTDYSAKRCGKHVTVFGWSQSSKTAAEGTIQRTRYDTACSLGQKMASRGYGCVTGGYCGSMEAVSEGCRSVEPAAPTTPALPYTASPAVDRLTSTLIEDAPGNSVAVRGVLCSQQFPDRVLEGNRYLTEHIDSKTLLPRIETLCSLTRYYVVLEGTLGSLQELITIWGASSLSKKENRPVVLAWRAWETIITHCSETLGIPQDYVSCIEYVDSVEECVAKIEADYEKEMSKENK